MTLELSVFVCKQSNVDTKAQEIDLIEEIYEEDSIILLCIFYPLEMTFVIDAQFIENFSLYDVYHICSASVFQLLLKMKDAT